MQLQKKVNPKTRITFIELKLFNFFNMTKKFLIIINLNTPF